MSESPYCNEFVLNLVIHQQSINISKRNELQHRLRTFPVFPALFFRLDLTRQSRDFRETGHLLSLVMLYSEK